MEKQTIVVSRLAENRAKGYGVMLTPEVVERALERGLLLSTQRSERIVLVWAPSTRTVISVLSFWVARRNIRNDQAVLDSELTATS